jgi:hypothetical protein
MQRGRVRNALGVLYVSLYVSRRAGAWADGVYVVGRIIFLTTHESRSN